MSEHESQTEFALGPGRPDALSAEVASPRPQQMPLLSLLEHVRDVAERTAQRENSGRRTRPETEGFSERDEREIDGRALTVDELHRFADDGERARAG